MIIDCVRCLTRFELEASGAAAAPASVLACTRCGFPLRAGAPALFAADAQPVVSLDPQQAVLDAIGVPWRPSMPPGAAETDGVLDEAVAALGRLALGRLPLAMPTERPSPLPVAIEGHSSDAPEVVLPALPSEAPVGIEALAPETAGVIAAEPAPEELETELELSPAEIAELLAADRCGTGPEPEPTPTPPEEWPESPDSVAPSVGEPDSEPTAERRLEAPPTDLAPDLEPSEPVAPPTAATAEAVGLPAPSDAHPEASDAGQQEPVPVDPADVIDEVVAPEVPPRAQVLKTSPQPPASRPDKSRMSVALQSRGAALPTAERESKEVSADGDRPWGLQLLMLALLAGAVALVLYYLLNMTGG